MQFFHIDYMNNGKKERNIGFLKIERDGASIGLRGVPAQCGERCIVYAVNMQDEKVQMGEIPINSGYGMKKLKWHHKVGFEQCVRIEIPLYGTRKGLCVLRDSSDCVLKGQNTKVYQENEKHIQIEGSSRTQVSAVHTPNYAKSSVVMEPENHNDIYEEIEEDKWKQLLKLYPQVHICSDAQSILIRPKDVVILTRSYHELATNSFVLHAYYNYRQLLLFRYMQSPVQYYLGVPGVYYERERRIAQLFGFEGFENGEARMQKDADRKTYNGCFGYYMKHVEI